MKVWSCFAVTCVSLVLSQCGDTSAQAQLDDAGFYSSHIDNKLEIGTRINHIVLLDDKRGEPYNGSFVGSVTQLREDQDYLPVRFYVQYKFWSYLGIGASYDKVGAEAGDWGLHGPGTGGADGTVELSGPLLYLLGCYPNSTRFTPFCELGAALYSADFEGDAGWGGGKEMVLEDKNGFYCALGCDCRLHDWWSINIYGRYVNVDVDGVYNLNGDYREDVLFTMSHLAFGIGAKYTF